MATTKNPIEWAWDQLRLAAVAVGLTVRAVRRTQEKRYFSPPAVRRIEVAGLRDILAEGCGMSEGTVRACPTTIHELPAPQLASIGQAITWGQL